MTYPPSLCMRPLARRLAAGTMLGGAALFAGACDDTVTDVPDPTMNVAASDVHGETIYRGLFFASGELGSLAEDVWMDGVPRGDAATGDPEVMAAAHELEGDLVRWIRRNEPTFFDEFHAAMTSGNHVRVDRMLDRAGSVSLAAFQDAADGPTRAALGMDTMALRQQDAAILVVVYRTFVAAIHTVALVWRVKVISPMAAGVEGSELARDEAVARLVTAMEDI